MSWATRLGERLRAPRIFDLGAAHTWASPRTPHSPQPAHLEPPPASLASATLTAALVRPGAPMR